VVCIPPPSSAGRLTGIVAIVILLAGEPAPTQDVKDGRIGTIDLKISGNRAS
jgi:hypothetical protein